MAEAGFIFATCQVGAEAALKSEMARRWPAFRFAYSRPGFLTFKLPSAAALSDDFDLHSVFARAYGFSLGKVSGGTIEQRAADVWPVVKGHGMEQFDRLHVWQRDLYEPGFRSYEPGPTALAAEADRAIRTTAPALESPARVSLRDSHEKARPGEMILDCVIVEPEEWWIGYHRAGSIPSRWPGGFFEMPLPADAVSRAYLKMEESLAWSRMPLRSGDLWVEIGSAPGGAAQALLSHGVKVIGIDPADMDPAVVANPNFAHWKKRGADVKRREFRGVRYLTADINVAPTYTLDTVENIVTHGDVRIEGVILTLKLLEWKLADEIPAYLDRVRSWGYQHVRARQLHHNRQEICVAARRK